MENTVVNVMEFPDGRLDARNAALYLGCSEQTLANHRGRGTGPRYVKRGRIYYFRADLDEWIAKGLAMSTAQARGLAAVTALSR